MLSCPQTNEARLPGPFLGGIMVQGMVNRLVSLKEHYVRYIHIYTSTSPVPLSLPKKVLAALLHLFVDKIAFIINISLYGSIHSDF